MADYDDRRPRRAWVSDEAGKESTELRENRSDQPGDIVSPVTPGSPERARLSFRLDPRRPSVTMSRRQHLGFQQR